MTFPLDYPLGGSRTEGRVLYERDILRIVPPWLRRTVGGAIMKALGMCVDSLIDRAVAGVALRFPNSDPDALAIMGRERRIIRGPSESADAYALRVQGWLAAHQRRGSVYAMLDQWHAYNADAVRQVDVVYYSGTRYVLDTAGDITRDDVEFAGDSSGQWAQAWCFLYEAADPGALTDAEAAALTIIPRVWNTAHMLPLFVVILWPEVGLWDYPPGIWDEPGALWTDDEPIVLEAS